MFKRFPSLLVLSIATLAILLIAFGKVQAQDPEAWTRAVPISGALSGSSYPSVAADDQGNVHAIWGVTQADTTLYYSKYDGLAWSRPVDVLIGGAASLLAMDGRDVLHLVFPTGNAVVVTDANASDASDSRGWNNPLQLNKEAIAYMGSLLVDERGTLHATWVEKTKACDTCYQAVYGQSSDAGRSWELYRILSGAAVQPRATQVVRAPSGTLYAMWSIAPGASIPDGVAISISTDDGETWSETPILLNDEKDAIRQPILGVDAKGNLILIHNLGVKDETFYRTSSDQGATWSASQPVPGLFAAKTATGADYFALGKDSANALHLISIGRASKSQDLSSVYHIKWDGDAWSAPELVYDGDQFMEFPSLAVSNGNRLHLLFSTRDRYKIAGPPDSSFQIWYTTLVTDAAQATRVPLATLTPSPFPSVTEGPTGTATRRPSITPAPVSAPVSDETPTGDANPQFPILIGVVPVLGILLLVILANTLLRRRR